MALLRSFDDHVSTSAVDKFAGAHVLRYGLYCTLSACPCTLQPTPTRSTKVHKLYYKSTQAAATHATSYATVLGDGGAKPKPQLAKQIATVHQIASARTISGLTVNMQRVWLIVSLLCCIALHCIALYCTNLTKGICMMIGDKRGIAAGPDLRYLVTYIHKSPPKY